MKQCSAPFSLVIPHECEEPPLPEIDDELKDEKQVDDIGIEKPNQVLKRERENSDIDNSIKRHKNDGMFICNI